MERLRHVARAGSRRIVEPRLVVAETAEAIAALSPDPAALLTVCRQLLSRQPACGPLWWLCATLVANDDDPWRLAGEVANDGTGDRLASDLPDGARAAMIGTPPIAGRALERRGDLDVITVETTAIAWPGRPTRRSRLGGTAPSEMAPTDSPTVVEAAAIPAVMTAADLAVIEVEACSPGRAIAPIGSAMLAMAARHAGRPVWIVAGRGRRLPGEYLAAIERLTVPADTPWCSTVDVIDLDRFDSVRDKVVRPDGILALGAPHVLAAECAYAPEIIPPADVVSPGITTDGPTSDPTDDRVW